NWNVYRTSGSIPDGLSNTVAFSETIGVEDIGRGVWWHEWGWQYSHARTPNTSTPDEVWGGVEPSGNTTKWDYCDQQSTDAPCNGNAPTWSQQKYAARSRHPGGVNTCSIDGSVRFITDSIDVTTWQALGSIDGRDIISGQY